MTQRYGMTIPFDGAPLGEQRDMIVELEDLGYTDVWSAESDGADGFTPLVLASQWAPSFDWELRSSPRSRAARRVSRSRPVRSRRLHRVASCSASARRPT